WDGDPVPSVVGRRTDTAAARMSLGVSSSRLRKKALKTMVKRGYVATMGDTTPTLPCCSAQHISSTAVPLRAATQANHSTLFAVRRLASVADLLAALHTTPAEMV